MMSKIKTGSSGSLRLNEAATPLRFAVFEQLIVYTELTKARLNSLVLFTTWVGFVMASGAAIDYVRLAWTLAGTLLAALGSGAINQFQEQQFDAKMHRTARRPIPGGKISSRHALILGIVLSVLGTAVLALTINMLTATLAALTVLIYAFAYAPLKRKSSLCTIVGAVTGAIPPMIGWTAVTNSAGYGAWMLFAILFIWQIPHFLALAWMYREDYERGGFVMLPAEDKSGNRTFRMLLLYTLAMIPVCALPTMLGYAGWPYFAVSVILGLVMLFYCIDAYRERSIEATRTVFRITLAYLPILMLVMVLDRTM